MAATVQPDPRTAAIVARLSQPRLAPYVAAAGGNVKDGLRLYQWNIDLSGAVYEALHVFEVVLRNAMDAELSVWNATQVNSSTGQPHSSDWLMDPSHLLGRIAGGDLPKAVARARTALRTGKAGGRAPGHPDVLAQLSFGTWRFLLPSRDPGRQLLWTQALSLSFPGLTTGPAPLVRKIDGIYRLRNRVAHLEPLLRSGVVHSALKSMREVLVMIDPAAEGWFTSRQRVTGTLRARP